MSYYPSVDLGFPSLCLPTYSRLDPHIIHPVCLPCLLLYPAFFLYPLSATSQYPFTRMPCTLFPFSATSPPLRSAVPLVNPHHGHGSRSRPPFIIVHQRTCGSSPSRIETKDQKRIQFGFYSPYTWIGIPAPFHCPFPAWHEAKRGYLIAAALPTSPSFSLISFVAPYPLRTLKRSPSSFSTLFLSL